MCWDGTGTWFVINVVVVLLLFMVVLIDCLTTNFPTNYSSYSDSGAEPDIRNGTVPECWNGWLDEPANKCRSYAPTPAPTGALT